MRITALIFRIAGVLPALLLTTWHLLPFSLILKHFISGNPALQPAIANTDAGKL